MEGVHRARSGSDQMAVARTIVVLCDVCLYDENRENPDAVELPPIGIGNKQPRVIALCP